jgi:hypothetical protein
MIKGGFFRGRLFAPATRDRAIDMIAKPTAMVMAILAILIFAGICVAGVLLYLILIALKELTACVTHALTITESKIPKAVSPTMSPSSSFGLKILTPQTPFGIMQTGSEPGAPTKT